jgi:hypothetical protein
MAAENFRESVSEVSNNKIYVTIGKVDAWANDADPDDANSSISSINEIWHQMIGGKIITGNDIRHVIPRYNWTENTSFAEYDHRMSDADLFNANNKFYVVTDQWNVYKCISNNNGAVSNTKPTSLTTDATFQTADGYVWKFMYQISSAERFRFTTDEYIPVKYLTENDNSLQWSVQEGAVDGAINSIRITNTGSGYSNANSVTISITGDGTGATAVATINASNMITNLTIVTPGRDYTFANVSITDTGTGVNAAAFAIISPQGGHGKDPLTELGGSYLIINPRIYGDEGGKILTNNDFRQLALVKDPYIFNTSNVANASAFSQCTKLTVSGASDEFIEDEWVYQGSSFASYTFKGKIAYWDTSNSVLYLTHTTGTYSTDLITGVDSAASRFVDSSTNPEMEPRSGKILYIDNIRPVERNVDQSEDIKVIFKF